MASALDWLMQRLGGDPEAEAAARTSAVMQPAVLDHLQNVLGDMPGRFGGTSYDPNRSLAQSALDPESLQQAVTIGMQVGPAAIRAYHGSPHDFERFDLSKIGTGEGAQAYGHGLYFADNPKVAEQYKMTGDSRFNRLTTGSMTPQQEFAHDLASGGHTELGILDMLARKYGGGISFEDANKLATDAVKARGRMYEVDLHVDPARLLDRDKPLSEQPHVKAALDALNVTAGPRWELLPKTAMATAPDRLTPQAAAVAFREAGIPGAKYLDQGSRGAGGGTSNYVMYDDKLIEILRKYGLAGLTAGTGAAAFGGTAEAAPADALDRIRRQLGGAQ